jgi:hypothetical protein
MGNDTQTLALTEFLLARIAEDEAAALACKGRGEWVQATDRGIATVHGIRIADTHALATAHIARHDPARVLAESKAKRRIVERHEGVADSTAYGSPTGYACRVCLKFHADYDCENEQWPCATIRALAAVYADHPDYREEWGGPE